MGEVVSSWYRIMLSVADVQTDPLPRPRVNKVSYLRVVRLFCTFLVGISIYRFGPTTTNTMKQYGSSGFAPLIPSHPRIEAEEEAFIPSAFSALANLSAVARS